MIWPGLLQVADVQLGAGLGACDHMLVYLNAFTWAHAPEPRLRPRLERRWACTCSCAMNFHRLLTQEVCAMRSTSGGSWP